MKGKKQTKKKQTKTKSEVEVTNVKSEFWKGHEWSAGWLELVHSGPYWNAVLLSDRGPHG